MSYRLGQSLSALVRTTVDGANTVDASVAVALAASSSTSFTPLSVSAIRAQIQSLAGRAVRPFNEPEARFAGIVHPFAWGDAINDTSNNAPIDIMKHTVEGLMRMEELPSTDLTEVFRLPATGVDFFHTNLVTNTANYKATGSTALRTYLFGRDGVIAINLAGRGDTAYGDGDYRGIKCNVVQNAPISVADPEGLIPRIKLGRTNLVRKPALIDSNPAMGTRPKRKHGERLSERAFGLSNDAIVRTLRETNRKIT